MALFVDQFFLSRRDTLHFERRLCSELINIYTTQLYLYIEIYSSCVMLHATCCGDAFVSTTFKWWACCISGRLPAASFSRDDTHRRSLSVCNVNMGLPLHDFFPKHATVECGYLTSTRLRTVLGSSGIGIRNRFPVAHSNTWSCKP